MAFIKNEREHQIGDVVTTSMEHQCLAGKFEAGTEVMIVGMSRYGYEIKDKEGNKMSDIGWLI